MIHHDVTLDLGQPVRPALRAGRPTCRSTQVGLERASPPLVGPVRGCGPSGLSRGDEARPRPDHDPARVRWALIQRVRREIALGGYDAPAKWEVVVDRLLERGVL